MQVKVFRESRAYRAYKVNREFRDGKVSREQMQMFRESKDSRAFKDSRVFREFRA